jgi:sentrin-specific protease 8
MSKVYADDEMVVNYHDACLYGRDLKLLDSPTAWLNDSCIHYQFMRLQQDFPQHLFIDPSVLSFLMHQCDEEDDLRDFRHSHGNFARYNRIFLPINDDLASDQWQIPGQGTHWSLILICDASYFHFDSVKKNNDFAAAAVAQQWHKMIGDSVEPKIVSCQAPQQVNGYDCGLHVLATAEFLAATDANCSQQELEAHVRDHFEQGPNLCAALRQRIAQDARKRALAG